MEALLSPKQLAARLGIAVGTLADWRLNGTGPDFMRIGKHVRYDPSVVAAWLKDQAARRGAA